MQSSRLVKWGMAIMLTVSASLSALTLSPATAAAPVSSRASSPKQAAAPRTSTPSGPLAPKRGRPGYAMEAPVASSPATRAKTPIRSAITGSTYTHTPAPNSANDVTWAGGSVMQSLTIYYAFWLGTDPGATYANTAAGTTDASYEDLLIQFAQDLGGSQYHNLLTQYTGNNSGSSTPISNSVSFGGSWIDVSNPYPHVGTTNDPLQDGDIQNEVQRAALANGWPLDLNHLVAVFTATGIQECNGSTCTFNGGQTGFCAYHGALTTFLNGTTAPYAFMAYDNFTHVDGYTCVAGQTIDDTDPNRFSYPNNDESTDAEIDTLSHELFEAQSDPVGNLTWNGPNGEIGDACNFNFAPRNDNGADVYLNGHPYIVQQEYSNAAHTCGMDLPTYEFCSGSVSQVCAPSTAYSETVSNGTPQAGTQVNYTLTLNNTNDTAAETNLAVSDTLASGYTVNSVSYSDLPTVSYSSSSVTVSYGTLPVHQQETVTITATVSYVTDTNCGSLAGFDLVGYQLPGQTTSPCASTSPPPPNGNLKVYAGGQVTLNADNRCDMWARNAATGAVVWRAMPATVGGHVNQVAPTIANGVVYYGCDDGAVYALNASTGALLWRYLTGAAIAGTPVVVNGVLYVGSDDDKIYALNANTGALIWRYRTGGYVVGTPAVTSSAVYVASTDGYLYALSTSSGHLQWKDPVETCAGCALEVGPVVANGVVYTPGTAFYALNASTGATIWSYPLAWETDAGGPLVANGVVYFNGVSGGANSLVALNASTGSLVWTVPATIWTTTPVFANGLIVYTDLSTVEARDPASGSLSWSFTGWEEALVNGVVYGPTGGTGMVASETPDGGRLWSYSPTSSGDQQVPSSGPAAHMAVGP